MTQKRDDRGTITVKLISEAVTITVNSVTGWQSIELDLEAAHRVRGHLDEAITALQEGRSICDDLAGLLGTLPAKGAAPRPKAA